MGSYEWYESNETRGQGPASTRGGKSGGPWGWTIKGWLIPPPDETRPPLHVRRTIYD